MTNAPCKFKSCKLYVLLEEWMDCFSTVSSLGVGGWGENQCFPVDGSCWEPLNKDETFGMVKLEVRRRSHGLKQQQI